MIKDTPIRVVNDSTNETRELYWDEENQLMVLSDNGKTSRYTYNAAGERIMKSYGTMEGVYINGAPQGITFHETDNFTLYPASIISINKNRFTKHYFIGDKRVASRIGTGMFNNVYGRNGSYVTAGQQDYAERMNQIQTQKEAYYKKVGVAPGAPTEKGAYGDPENTGVGYNAVLTELGNHDVPQGWIQTPRPNTTPNTNPGPPVSWNDPSNPDDPQAGYGYIPNDTTKEETFFYHSDHLGSTSYITDDKANITQYDAYLPYGELLVDEHSSSEDLPYKFNGKQFDDETGLYYYGARYMNPMASLWYGVDPLAEKYNSIGGYVYCIGNPIRLVDPDGKKIVLVGTYKEKMKTLSNLQSLTNDNLYLNKTTGVVTIGGKRWSNRNSHFTAGTKLIRTIINSKKTTEIGVNSQGINKAHSIYRQDAYNGKGTDVRITYDPNQEHSPEVLVRNPRNGNSSYEVSPVIINLGHELVHAERALYGRQASDDTDNKHDEALGQYLVTRPNGLSYKITDELEELQTTGIKSIFINSSKATSGNSQFTENILRKEHGYNERVEY